MALNVFICDKGMSHVASFQLFGYHMLQIASNDDHAAPLQLFGYHVVHNIAGGDHVASFQLLGHHMVHICTAVVLNHISSHFLIPLSDSSLICTVSAQ